MAIDDNTIYGLYGSQVKDLPEKVDAVKGKARILTTADYNYPANNPDGVALWLLEPGTYAVYSDIKWYLHSSLNYTGQTCLAFIGPETGGQISILYNRNSGDWMLRTIEKNTGAAVGSRIFLLTTDSIVDNLTSSSATNVLSAKQGKVLKDLVDSIAIRASGAPTTSTAGQVGTLYEDTTNGDLYICTDATNPYVWEEVGAGGGGPTVVQTTGTSTTDVMSQKATTDMVFRNGSGAYVQIGTDATGSGLNCVAIGRYATASQNDTVAVGRNASAAMRNSIALGRYAITNHEGSIALGANSQTSYVGEVNIGSTQTSTGYNSSNYRLLTGVYDPQSAHDAATKGYVDTALTAKQDELTAGENITIQEESGALVISATGGGADVFTTNEWNALWA